MSTEMVPSCMEKINELTEGKATHWKTFGRIWTNLAGFFKALPDSGLVENGKQAKGGKKSKRLTAAFFVNATIIWKSKLPRCFKKLEDPLRSANVHYFSTPKSWMTSEVM